jgi:hemerythrin-like domain-containing protein
MKRSNELVPLSWDHHTGLTMAKRIPERLRSGAAPADMAAYVLHQWEAHLRGHFDKEEQLLAPLIHAHDEGKALNSRLFDEHQQIAALIEQMRQNDRAPLSPILLAFAALIKAHIKFEESVYFPAVESLLPPETLAGLGDILHREHHEANPRDGLP